jgi:hypothetical protein
LQGEQLVDIVNAQELISSKLAGLLDDSRQKHGGDDDEELSSVAVDAVGSAAASPRAVRGTASATRHRIAGVCAHIIAAAAAAFGIPYGLWFLALADPSGFGSGSIVLILQPLLQVLLLRVAVHVSWLCAERERWSSPKQLHVVLAAR